MFGSNANLSGADLQSTNFSESLFDGACLVRANVAGARSSRADLGRPDLTDANLKQAHSFEAKFIGARLTRAYLTGVDLAGADFNGAFLDHARLADANLYYTTLPGADLTHAMLAGADLAYAVFPAPTCRTRIASGPKCDWALPLLEYSSADTLLAAFENKVISPALEKLAEVRRRKALPPQRRSAEN